jgi:hypothetical protein
MRRYFNILYIVVSIIFLIYLALPNKEFPIKSDHSLQSFEPADIESPNRQGYYNNETRAGVILFYRNEFDKVKLFNLMFNMPSLRLNYPPEDAQVLIRDQTRSTYLEEIVHPFRESLYINGFEPSKDSDAIIVNGSKYKQKIIIKMVNSNVILRTIIGLLSLTVIYLNIIIWINIFRQFNKTIYER